jgi:hypothetical protein
LNKTVLNIQPGAGSYTGSHYFFNIWIWTSPKNQPPQEARLHFLDYWRIIRIRKAIIITVFLITAIIATAVTFILPVSYSSTSQIKIAPDNTAGRFGHDRAMEWHDVRSSKHLRSLIFSRLNLKFFKDPTVLGKVS